MIITRGMQVSTPVVSDINIYDEWNLDMDLQKIRQAFPRPTPQNCEWAFWNESVAQSYAYMTAAIQVGKGFEVMYNGNRSEKKVSPPLCGKNITGSCRMP